jgi:AraC-like DNA-binding protein
MVHGHQRPSIEAVDPAALAIRTVLRAGDAVPAPRAVFVNLYSVGVRRNTVWERHRHADHEAIVVERGRYRCRLNGIELSLAAGQALVAKPGDWHEDLLDQGVRYHALVFTLEGGALFVPGIAPAQQVAAGAWRDWEGLLAPLRADGEAGGATPHLQDAAVVPALWRLVRGLDPGALAAPFAAGDDGARTIRLAFERTLGRRATVAGLARELGLSERGFDRRCRAVLGLPPARALLRHRLERAAHLLRHTPWPVKQIAAHLGFANAFHFTRAFARLHGMPPTRYRGGPAGPETD